MQCQAGYNWLLTVYTVKCCINLYTSLLSTCMPKEWQHFFNSLMSLCINGKINFYVLRKPKFLTSIVHLSTLHIYRQTVQRTNVTKLLGEILWEFLPFPLHHGLYRSTPSCFLVWDTLTQHCFSENNQIKRVKFLLQKVE